MVRNEFLIALPGHTKQDISPLPIWYLIGATEYLAPLARLFELIFVTFYNQKQDTRWDGTNGLIVGRIFFSARLHTHDSFGYRQSARGSKCGQLHAHTGTGGMPYYCEFTGVGSNRARPF